jgi:tRNA/rRNA methyltransferase
VDAWGREFYPAIRGEPLNFHSRIALRGAAAPGTREQPSGCIDARYFPIPPAHGQPVSATGPTPIPGGADDERVRPVADRIRIVLCRPNHPGNIGSAARAMKNMGLSDLRLVAPARYPAPEARWMAVGADDVLDAARVHARLDEALEGCVHAFALSARPREWSPEVLNVRDAAALALRRGAEGQVAFVFGNEVAGLTNEEMFACQTLVHIPADPAYTSLNLAQAVQVVVYELRMAVDAHVPAARRERAATHQDREGLYRHLEEAGVASGFFDPADPKRLPDRWRRLFGRIDLEREEVNILRGLLRALMKKRE